MLPSRPAGRGGCPRPPRDRRVSLGSQLFLHLALGPGLNPQTLAAHHQLTQSQRGCAPRTSCASTPSNFAGPPAGATWLASWLAVDDAGWQAELGCTCCPRTSHPRLASPAANSAISRETQSPAMLAHRHLQCFSSCSTPARITLSHSLPLALQHRPMSLTKFRGKPLMSGSKDSCGTNLCRSLQCSRPLFPNIDSNKGETRTCRLNIQEN